MLVAKSVVGLLPAFDKQDVVVACYTIPEKCITLGGFVPAKWSNWGG